MLTSTVTLRSHIRNLVHMRIRTYHKSAYNEFSNVAFNLCGEEIIPFFLKQAHASMLDPGEIKFLTTFLDDAKCGGDFDNMRKEFLKYFPYVAPIGLAEATLAASFSLKFLAYTNVKNQAAI